MRIALDSKGPGSFEQMLAHLESALRENCVLRDEVFVTAVREDPERRLARCLLISILSRLDIAYERD